MDEQLELIRVTEPLDEWVADVGRLLAQLTTRSITFTRADLEALVASDASWLYLARLGGTTVGMATIGTYLAPTGRKYWLEDVVVDVSCRGRGVARTMLGAIAATLEGGMTAKLYLTSNPARVAANRLYQSMGFERKVTNVYCSTLPLPATHR